LDKSSLDLDPRAAGGQSSLTVDGGTLTTNGGTVVYQPRAGFTGRVEFSYTVADAAGRVSQPASALIRVA
jgi:mannan endo-1,4-beta-mannosidase